MQRGVALNICECGYNTYNLKSWSNHTRYGCKEKKDKFIEEKCMCCGNNLPKRKPSEKGFFCNRSCYMIHRKTTNPKPNLKTGESRTRLYVIWLGMKRRCTKTNCKDYHNYGGRGINVCNEWSLNFLSFKGWAYRNGYSDNLTIERIDVNGNYEPFNCTWITLKDQAKNKRNSIKNRINQHKHLLE